MTTTTTTTKMGFDTIEIIINFHNSVGCSLILVMVQVDVYLINASDGLIMNSDHSDICHSLSIYLVTFSYLATVYVCPGKAR